MNRQRVTLRIQGRVQGVFFRQSAQAEAKRLGLKGWIRNLESGEVEALAEGEPAAVQAFVEWCRRGPPAARVSDVVVTSGTPTGEHSDFGVVR